MARSRYTITEPDMAAALAYIGSKLRDPWWPSEDTTAQVKAERGFRIAKRDSVTLNGWCEKHINTAQWFQLKNVIRAARKRTVDLSRDPPKSVTLSHKAWRIISDLAKRDGVTLSALNCPCHSIARTECMLKGLCGHPILLDRVMCRLGQCGFVGYPVRGVGDEDKVYRPADPGR